MIAIAHRLSTIAAMDRLIVIDQGRVVEEGSHAQLIAQGGIYADLWAASPAGSLAMMYDARQLFSGRLKGSMRMRFFVAAK